MTRTVTLATFPLPDRGECYWQVTLKGSGPVIRETTSQADATAAFHRVCKDLSAHGWTVTRMFWNGYLGEEYAL